MKIRYTQTSLRQIAAALDYVALNSIQGETGLQERIRQAAELLKAHPHAGVATERKGLRRLVLTPFPYVIFYRIRASEVVVSRFRHAARRPSRP